MAESFGKITQVIGPVVDIAFEGEGVTRPAIYTALSVPRENGTNLILEVEQHIG
ncbi:MAG: F0F1 ATP synthase subunit beta, partial [Muribaculaceae bacterium]|nr:F0F1 ATP synthase subunit beta [Muribaculaceae bacterium]